MGRLESSLDLDSGCRQVQQELLSLDRKVILYSLEKKSRKNVRTPQADSRYAATRQGVCCNELRAYHSLQENQSWLDDLKCSRGRDDTQLKVDTH